MLSDEEKKAIDEILLSIIEAYSDDEDLQKISEEYKNTKTILNLIEKQQKEIEELKDSNNKLYSILQENKKQTKYSLENNDKKWEDKIKAKIEELQKDIQYSANPLSIDNSKFGIKVLQSLLEKE